MGSECCGCGKMGLLSGLAQGFATMLSPELVRRAELLAPGDLSSAAIAIRLGVSRATVDTIAAGKHPHQKPSLAPKSAEGDPAFADRVIGTCPTCGARLTEAPCRACSCRALPRLAAAALAIQEGEMVALGIDLHGGYRRRYQKLYRRKRAEQPQLPRNPPSGIRAFRQAQNEPRGLGGEGAYEPDVA